MTVAAAEAAAPAKRPSEGDDGSCAPAAGWGGFRPPGVAQTWSGAAAPAEPRVSRPSRLNFFPARPSQSRGPYRRGEPELLRVVGMRACGVPMHPGQLSHSRTSGGRQGQSSRCPGRSSAQLGSQSRRLKCRFQSGFSGGRRPLGEASPVAAAICGTQRCRSVLFRICFPWASSPLGALFYFLTFQS